MKRVLKYILLGVTAVILYMLFFRDNHTGTPRPIRDYQAIMQSGTLHAVTEYNSISFHVQGDSLGGLNYELLQAFAQSKNLKLEVSPETDFKKQVEGILNGEYDILANSVPVTRELKDTMLFTHPIILNKQVLVQRKPEYSNDSCYISSHLELAGKTIHVTQNSPSVLRIKNLSHEIGDTIYIEVIEKYGPEHLLAMVANGDISYTVCDENIAINSLEGLPQLDISIPIGFTQFYSWGINKSNNVLLDSLNVWLEHYKGTDSFKRLIKKYLPQ